MRRFTHLLAANSRVTRPERMVFVDTETDPQPPVRGDIRQEFKLGVAHYWRHRRDGEADQQEWFEFTQIPAFWDWCLKKPSSHSPLYLVAHNLAFDVLVLRMVHELPARGWKHSYMVNQKGARMIQWGYPTAEFSAWLKSGKARQEHKGERWVKTILMLDNLNLFPDKLEEWGKVVGFPKLPMPDTTAPRADWFTYCHRDVEIMLELWQSHFAFLDEENLGTFKPTQAAQAFTGYRHAYMDHAIEIHTNSRAIDLERSAFFGGRTEPFWIGKREDGEFYYLDVNSLYPHVMKGNSYPARLVGIDSGLSVPDLSKMLKRFGVIASVDLDEHDAVFPLRENKRNVYKCDPCTLSLTTPELLYALERDWILKVRDYAMYKMAPIFETYVDHFYALKVKYAQEGNLLRKKQVKLFLNSVYGKFGQHGYEDVLLGGCDPRLVEIREWIELQTGIVHTDYCLGGTKTTQCQKGEAFNSFVAIPAHVAAYGRLHLWALIERAGRGHVFYVDTDSLIVDRCGYDALAHLVDPDRLGYLKVEGVAGSLEIRARKAYTFGEKRVEKGITEKAEYLGNNTYRIELWPGLKAHLEAGQTDTYHNHIMVKHLTYSVDWGVVEWDGWIRLYKAGATPLLF